jgi:hypothetical protein
MVLSAITTLVLDWATFNITRQWGDTMDVTVVPDARLLAIASFHPKEWSVKQANDRCPRHVGCGQAARLM